MTKETLMYYNKEISMLGISECTKKKLRSNLKMYYRYFRNNESNNNLECRIQERFILKRNEARYVYLLCKIHYLNDTIPLPPEDNEEKEVEEYEFNNLDEWAEDRAKKGRKFKNPNFYKYLVQNYSKYKQKELMRLLEKEFKLTVPEGYIGPLYREYLIKVEVKEA